MNLMTKLFGASYDDLWKAVIRPPRDNYEDYDLGPEVMMIKNKNFKRTDFTILNKKNQKLFCSFWEPFDEEREYDRLPTVVYLHGNSSSRAEAVSEVAYLLPMNICLFAFDFSGCGRSEGDFISLGWYEREDVECVIDFLRKSNKVSTIGLWGRSMGAVTAIMYGDKDPSIAGMVLDSPFSSLKRLVEELVKDKVNLPNFVINQALKLVKSTVHKKANFKLDDIEPIQFAERCYIPALFVAANNDNFVKPHHAKILHDIYPGDKNLVNIEGDHNSHRPRFFKDSATIFFYNTLQVQYIKEISDNYAGYYKKKNDIFEDEKKEANEIKNGINLGSGNNEANLFNNANEKKGNFVPQVSSDANLNNIDFEGIEDEEEILKMILEKSKKDFDELELKNKNNSNKIINENNISNNIKIKDNIAYESSHIIFNNEDKNNTEINNNRILLNDLANSNDKNNLFDFLNSQIKNNNKDNINEIKNIEDKVSKDNEQNFENNVYNFRDKTYENKSKKIEMDLINVNFDENKGRTERTDKK